MIEAEIISGRIKPGDLLPNDDRGIIALDIEFHRLVAEVANNAALVLTREPISVMLFSATLDLYKRVPVARKRLLQAHRKICDAIVARNPADARLWMAKHITDFCRGYLVAGIDLNAPIGLDAGTAARAMASRPASAQRVPADVTAPGCRAPIRAPRMKVAAQTALS